MTSRSDPKRLAGMRLDTRPLTRRQIVAHGVDLDPYAREWSGKRPDMPAAGRHGTPCPDCTTCPECGNRVHADKPLMHRGSCSRFSSPT